MLRETFRKAAALLMQKKSGQSMAPSRNRCEAKRHFLMFLAARLACIALGHKSRAPRPRRIRVEAASNRHDYLPHSRCRQNTPLSREQNPLVENLHVMSL